MSEQVADLGSGERPCPIRLDREAFQYSARYVGDSDWRRLSTGSGIFRVRVIHGLN